MQRLLLLIGLWTAGPDLLAADAENTAKPAADQAAGETADPSETADSPTVMPEVDIVAKRSAPVLAEQTQLSDKPLADKQAQVSDTARLLEDQAGVSFQSNGGVTSLPVVRGLNDDRIKIEINGMQIPAACPNHMNPSLSYIDPSNVGKIELIKGITPVSMGGDSIAGTISVQSAAPVFAKSGEGTLVDGKISSFFRSNGSNFGGNLTAGVASETARLEYTGSDSESQDYFDGNGQKIKSSSYINQNQAMLLAFKSERQLLEFRGGQEYVPFQGYPTARMEMTYNYGIFGNLHYLGDFDWGKLEGKAYLENNDHAMNYGTDIRAVAPGVTMPMNSEARNLGYKLQAEIPYGAEHTFRVGHEAYRQVLYDFWPAVCNSVQECGGPYAYGNMGPNQLININNGTRDRIGAYAEWDAAWSPRWKSQVGVRYDHTITDTGNVQGYNSFVYWYGYTADAFNNQSHQRNFDAIDLTALMQFTANDWSQYEFGYARKNRMPSLYELYLWNTSPMVMTMLGWFGDGNGYVGNLHLRQETAHNLTFSANYYDPANNAWEIKASPYFSYVENFIDADRCVQFGCVQPSNGYYYMQIANHDAWLWGGDLSGRADLYHDPDYGNFATHSVMSYVRGQRADGNNLYHMMPFNLRWSLDHQLETWNNSLEMQFVSSKNDVQALRGELQTPSYILLNAKTGYQWKNLTMNLGVDNLLDKQYFSPLGGTYIGYYYTMDLSNSYPNRNLPGYGRSVYVAMTLTF